MVAELSYALERTELSDLTISKLNAKLIYALLKVVVLSMIYLYDLCGQQKIPCQYAALQDDLICALFSLSDGSLYVLILSFCGDQQ
jgi:hypothetical protein